MGQMEFLVRGLELINIEQQSFLQALQQTIVLPITFLAVWVTPMHSYIWRGERQATL